MDTQKVKLSQVTENVENPRTITDRNLQKLITSILVFPKMLAFRPIVVDDTMTALGGNMRLRALSAISTFSPEQITNRLQGCTDYEKKTPAEREALINYWRAWLEEPTTEVANDKTPHRRRKARVHHQRQRGIRRVGRRCTHGRMGCAATRRMEHRHVGRKPRFNQSR